jgi:hypothetical protein
VRTVAVRTVAVRTVAVRGGWPAWTVGLLLTLVTGVVCAGCLADPRRAQSARLFDQLVAAYGALGKEPPSLEDGCADVSFVGTRLSGEPGLVELRDAWPPLRRATDSLLAVCGQAALLAQPYAPTQAMLEARERWRIGADHELRKACEELARAASALDRHLTC